MDFTDFIDLTDLTDFTDLIDQKMTEEQDLMIQEYAKNPLQNFAMKEYTIKQHEGNFIC